MGRHRFKLHRLYRMYARLPHLYLFHHRRGAGHAPFRHPRPGLGLVPVGIVHPKRGIPQSTPQDFGCALPDLRQAAIYRRAFRHEGLYRVRTVCDRLPGFHRYGGHHGPDEGTDAPPGAGSSRPGGQRALRARRTPVRPAAVYAARSGDHRKPRASSGLRSATATAPIKAAPPCAASSSC